MARAAMELPGSMLNDIETIWCDSKATACYTVTVKPGPRQWAIRTIATAYGMVCLDTAGGHNGIVVYAADNPWAVVAIDPEWRNPDD
jgi:hypothetical protein